MKSRTSGISDGLLVVRSSIRAHTLSSGLTHGASGLTTSDPTHKWKSFALTFKLQHSWVAKTAMAFIRCLEFPIRGCWALYIPLCLWLDKLKCDSLWSKPDSTLNFFWHASQQVCQRFRVWAAPHPRLCVVWGCQGPFPLTPSLNECFSGVSLLPELLALVCFASQVPKESSTLSLQLEFSLKFAVVVPTVIVQV